MSRRRLLEQVIRTWHGGSADSHSAERKEVCRKNETLKREMYGQPAQNAPAVFSACQVQIFYSLSDAIFSSLIDDLFLAFFGSMEVRRSLSVLLRVRRRKKDLRDPKMPLQEGKRNEKSALAGLGERKSRARPEKSEKTGLES